MRVIVILTALAVLDTCGAQAELYVVNFDSDMTGDVAGQTLIYPGCEMYMGPHEFDGGPWAEILDWTYVSPPNSLGLAPATAYTTFTLDPGEYVDYVGVWMIDWAGQTNLHVIGAEGEVFYYTEGPGEWIWADTTGANIGEIVEARLTSYEGCFDDFTFNVVPEPAFAQLAGLLLGIGSIGWFRLRRS